MGFTTAGLPLGVTFSFLISSPMVDLGSLVLLMSIFGWKIAVAYVIVGYGFNFVQGKIESVKVLGSGLQKLSDTAPECD